MAGAIHWIEVEGGHGLALDAGEIVTRMPNGRKAAGVAKALRGTPAAERLQALKAWLDGHRRECVERVEGWMVTEARVPFAVIVHAWSDEAWVRALRDMVVAPLAADGAVDLTRAGQLREVDTTRGLRLGTGSGDGTWTSAERVVFPHPVLLPDSFREQVHEQAVVQLEREVFGPVDENHFAGQEFPTLSKAAEGARVLGYTVAGAFVRCLAVRPDGAPIEARFWLGSGDPESRTTSGPLYWVDGDEQVVPLDEVGAVALSEGVRMAVRVLATREGSAPPAAAPPDAPQAPLAVPAGRYPLFPDQATLVLSLETEPVEARHYRHDVLGGRVVVRFVPTPLAHAEDVHLQALGFAAPFHSEQIATQSRVARSFAALALERHPELGADVFSLLAELKGWTKLKPASIPQIAKTLAERLPPDLAPAFFETCARRVLEDGRRGIAASLFAEARARDTEVDDDGLRAVFAEFLLAGALKSGSVADFADGVAWRTSPQAAYAQLSALALTVIRGGLPPWKALLIEIRRFAAAAGLDEKAEERAFVHQVAATPTAARAPFDFWRAARKALAQSPPAVCRRLLAIFPHLGWSFDDKEPLKGQWFDLLALAGAIDLLSQEGGGAAARWLSAAVGWSSHPRLLETARRLASRLVADGVPIRLDGKVDLAFLESLCALQVPIELTATARATIGEQEPADPVHVAKVPGGLAVLEKLTDEELNSPRFDNLSRRLPTLVPLRHAAVARRLADLDGGVLTTASSALDWLEKHTTQAMYDETLYAALEQADIARALARTLRLFVPEELGWPAFEDAVEAFGGDEVRFGGAFPHAVVTNGRQAVVVGPHGRVMEHVLMLPEHRTPVDFVYSAGELRVVYGEHMEARGGYWWTSGKICEVGAVYLSRSQEKTAALLPDGSVTQGGRALRPGGRLSSPPGVVFDGQRFWRIEAVAYTHTLVRLREFHPGTGTAGPVSMPPFFASWDDAGTLRAECWMYPVPDAASPLGSREGLSAFRVRETKNGRFEAEGIDGRRHVGPFIPHALLTVPGCTQVRALAREHRTVRAAQGPDEGQAYESANLHAPVLYLAPHWWHLLTVRDEVGSRALRSTSEAACRPLLQAAMAGAQGEAPQRRFEYRDWLRGVSPVPSPEGADVSLLEEIEHALPEVTDPRLRVGVARLCLEAARIERRLCDFGARVKSDALRKRRVARFVSAGADLSRVGGRHLSAEVLRFLFESISHGIFYADDLGGEIARIARILLGAPPLPGLAAGLSWVDLIGCGSAAAFLASGGARSPEEVAELTGLLELWAETPFAQPACFRRLQLSTRNDEQVGWRFVRDGDNVYVIGSGGWCLEYAPKRAFHDPPGYTSTSTRGYASGWDAPDRLRRVAARLSSEGPPAWDPRIAQELARRTGLSVDFAAVLWGGGSTNCDHGLYRRLGIGDRAGQALQEQVHTYTPEMRRKLYTAVDPEAMQRPLGAGPDDDTSPVALFAEALKRLGKS